MFSETAASQRKTLTVFQSGKSIWKRSLHLSPICPAELIMALNPALLPALCEDPRLVHFLINIFMMDYDLYPMSWVKSHIWIPWCEWDLIIPVWGKLEIKGDLAGLISRYVLQSFNTSCHIDGHLNPLTIADMWPPWKALWSHRGEKRENDLDVVVK